jgi:hypothetical protein
MKSLEEEALEYVGINPNELIEMGDERIEDAGHFIAGANSKWVKLQTIQAMIGFIMNEMALLNYNIRKIYIDELEQQLKELIDEKS